MTDRKNAPKTTVALDPGGRRSHRRANTGRDALGLDDETAGSVQAKTLGVNPLIDAASPLFVLIVYLRDQERSIDTDALRDKLLVLVRTFERDALAQGYDQKTVRRARYALAVTLDDVVLNLPWGYDEKWQDNPLVQILEGITFGGDEFFTLLDQVRKDPVRNKDLHELMYVCLSLGFQGKYRNRSQLSEGGELEAMRGRSFEEIDNQRGGIDEHLSPRWRGEETRRRPLRAFLPSWLLASLAVAVAAMLYVGTLFLTGEPVARAVAMTGPFPTTAVPIIDRPDDPVYVPPPPPPDPGPDRSELRLRSLLAELQTRGVIDGIESGQRFRIVVNSRDRDGNVMFQQGKSEITPVYAGFLRDIGFAVASETDGPVIVEGHTDKIPMRPGRLYSNNLELSLARAQAAERLLTAMPELAGRTVLPEAKGARNLRYLGDTKEVHDKNRRIEIIVRRRSAGEEQ